MYKRLSIIIPRYKEAEIDLFPLLSSISIQVGINFSEIEVIISNDGGDTKLDEGFFSIFPMEIRQVYLEENKGPGVARQNGIDNALGEYVMCCDADDCLHNVGVLGAFFQEIDANKPDIIQSSWLEEIIDQEGHVAYLQKEIENTWMFGKMFRKAFLIENNIRFHDKLRVHEDSYFLSVAADLAKVHRHMPIVTYVWKFKPDSITRKDNGIYGYSSMPIFVDALTMSMEELKNRGSKNLVHKVCQFICYIYFVSQEENWNSEESIPYREAMEKEFVEKIRPFWNYYLDAPKDIFVRLYTEERRNKFSNQIEHETFSEWLKRLDLPEAVY